MKVRIPRSPTAAPREGRAAPPVASAEASRPVEPPSLDKRPQATSYRVEDLLELAREGLARAG